MAQRYSAFALARHALDPDLPWPRAWRSPAPKASYDAVIIGGGGHGLATAYYLAANHGITNVAVIERGYIGSGNVGRNTTIVRSNYMIDGNTQFFEFSLKLWEGLSHALNFNVMLSQRGQIVLAHGPSQLDVLARKGNIMRLNGIDAELLDRGEVMKLLPYLDYSPEARFPIWGGLLQRRAGTARHDAVAWGYARAADRPRRRHHRELRGHRLRHPGRPLSPASRPAAGRILAETHGHRRGRPLLPCRGHGGACACRSRATSCRPSSPSRSSPWSITSSPSGPSSSTSRNRTRAGSSSAAISTASTPIPSAASSPRCRPSPNAPSPSFPAISRLRLLRHWGGIMDMTPDGSPFIGRTPLRNLYINGGWCYQGFKADARRRAGASPTPSPRTRSMS